MQDDSKDAVCLYKILNMNMILNTIAEPAFYLKEPGVKILTPPTDGKQNKDKKTHFKLGKLFVFSNI